MTETAGILGNGPAAYIIMVGSYPIGLPARPRYTPQDEACRAVTRYTSITDFHQAISHDAPYMDMSASRLAAQSTRFRVTALRQLSKASLRDGDGTALPGSLVRSRLCAYSEGTTILSCKAHPHLMLQTAILVFCPFVPF